MKKPYGYRSFPVSITRDSGLKSLRIKYARAAPEKRRLAAQWEYDSSLASDLFSTALLKSGAETLLQPKWPPGFFALAIDPLFAPALLTVPPSCIKQTRREHFQSLVMRVWLTLNGL